MSCEREKRDMIERLERLGMGEEPGGGDRGGVQEPVEVETDGMLFWRMASTVGRFKYG